METADEEELINLTLVNGTAYVFNAKDYMKLREHHRILGAMVGTCSFRSFGLDERTLPVELMPWETTLLVEQNLVRILSKEQSLSGNPTMEQITEHRLRISHIETEQAEMMKLERLQDTQRNMKNILTGMNRKRLRNGQINDSIKNEFDVMKQVNDGFVFDQTHALIETPLEHVSEHSGYVCTVKRNRSLISCVFRECWLRDYYVMSGEAFGCNLLLYPGDPLLYHASHIIILLDKPYISALEFISKIRISVSVNKICVLAYFDTDKDIVDSAKNDWPTVMYQTIERDKRLTEDCELSDRFIFAGEICENNNDNSFATI